MRDIKHELEKTTKSVLKSSDREIDRRIISKWNLRNLDLMR
jgi:hypothetical protein